MSALGNLSAPLVEVVRGMRHWRDIVRLRPHEQVTPEGRAAERHRRMFWSAFANTGARGTGIVTTLITVPLTIHYLGTERYGMWMTISSLIALFAFVDFGLGSGLMTSISHAHGANDEVGARKLTSTSFLFFLGIASALGLVLGVVAPLLPWASLYNVTSAEAVADAGPATIVFLACNLVGLPLSIAEQVRAGYQSSFSHSFWVGLGNVFSLVSVLVAIHFKAGLPWLVVSMAGGPVVAALLSFISLFWFERPQLRPSPGFFSRAATDDLFRTGGLFVALHIAAFLSQGSDNFILIQLVGGDAVARYSVAIRLFGLAPMLLTLLTTPLWAAYGEAIARHDIDWVRTTLGRSLLLTAVVASAASVALLIIGRPLIVLWVGEAVLPPQSLLVGMAIWSVIGVVGHTLSMLLNAARVIRFQLICATLMTIAVLTLKIVLTKHWGLPGIVWGAILGYVPFSGIPAFFFVPMLLRDMKARAEHAQAALQ